MEKVNGEQPDFLGESENSISISQKDVKESSQENDGSLLGKFKTTGDLENAYNSLQAEFTKKCQRLKVLENQINNDKNNDLTTTIEKKSDDGNNIAVKVDEKVNNNSDKNFDTTPKILNTPKLYETDSWETKVSELLSLHPNAKKFSKEISEELLIDDNLGKSENGLIDAYNKVIAKNYKSPEELASDSSFITNYVLNNKNFNELLMKAYLAKLDNNAPTLISGNGVSLINNSNSPKSLEEAKEVALRLLS
jgi:hypothetical protein